MRLETPRDATALVDLDPAHNIRLRASQQGVALGRAMRRAPALYREEEGPKSLSIHTLLWTSSFSIPAILSCYRGIPRVVASADGCRESSEVSSKREFCPWGSRFRRAGT